MISSRNISKSPKSETVKSLKIEPLDKKSSIEHRVLSTTISIQMHHSYPVRCYESVMPPPPHYMLNALNNNNNNSTKNFNRSTNWNNQKRPYRENIKNNRQGTYKCDKEQNTSKVNYARNNKSADKNNVKFIYSKNWGNHNNLSNTHNTYFTGLYQDQFFSYMSPHHTPNKERFYTNRQHDRLNKNKRTYNPDYHLELVDIIMDKFLARSKIVEIKKQPENLLTGGEWDSLNKQIWMMFTTRQQTEEIYIKKINLWKYLYIFIRKIFPRYGLFLVGSTMSGFGTNASDVDMCLLVRPTYVDQRLEALNYLEQIKFALHECDFVDRAELICAKVPILKFHDTYRNLEVDLNCNNSVGIRNTHLLHCYANMDWRVRPLVLVVKMWANKNNINDAKNMTISSYSLALMVIHYLQCGVAPPVVPCLHGLYPGKFLPDSDIHNIDMQEQLLPFHSDNPQTLGELFLGFLHYYTIFDYMQFAISVRLGARIPIDECRMARSYKNDPHQWKYLCIEEPFDLTNTARSVYDPHIFERIKAVFAHSFHTLSENRDLLSIFNDDDGNEEI